MLPSQRRGGTPWRRQAGEERLCRWCFDDSPASQMGHRSTAVPVALGEPASIGGIAGGGAGAGGGARDEEEEEAAEEDGAEGPCIP